MTAHSVTTNTNALSWPPANAMNPAKKPIAANTYAARTTKRIGDQSPAAHAEK
jgi:hypothetical protein